MTNAMFSSSTKVLAVTAVLAALLFSVGQATAGTQMPYWKKMQLQNNVVPTTPGDNSPGDKIQVVEEVMPPVNEDKDESGDGWNGGDFGGDGNGGSKPAAAPTPSAVAGGLAMLGLIAGRRRRQAQDD